MLEELVGEGAEPGGEGKMIVIFKLGPWYAEERLSRDKLKDKAAETPDINGIVNGSGKNQLGSPKAEWSNGLRRRVGKEICYSEHEYKHEKKKETDNRNEKD